MPADYGQFKDVVAIAGSILAAGTAIRLGWMRRAKWMPPAESVPGGTVKVSALVCSVVIAVLFLVRSQLGLVLMVVIAGVCLVLTLIALAVSIFTNTTYSFVRRPHGQKAETRMLGGSRLTDEALSINQKKKAANQPGLTVQQLFEYSHFKPDLVWTKESQALVQIASTMGFILLQVAGSIALASAAIAFSLDVPSGTQ